MQRYIQQITERVINLEKELEAAGGRPTRRTTPGLYNRIGPWKTDSAYGQHEREATVHMPMKAVSCNPLHLRNEHMRNPRNGSLAYAGSVERPIQRDEEPITYEQLLNE